MRRPKFIQRFLDRNKIPKIRLEPSQIDVHVESSKVKEPIRNLAEAQRELEASQVALNYAEVKSRAAYRQLVTRKDKFVEREILPEMKKGEADRLILVAQKAGQRVDSAKEKVFQYKKEEALIKFDTFEKAQAEFREAQRQVDFSQRAKEDLREQEDRRPRLSPQIRKEEELRLALEIRKNIGRLNIAERVLRIREEEN